MNALADFLARRLRQFGVARGLIAALAGLLLAGIVCAAIIAVSVGAAVWSAL